MKLPHGGLARIAALSAESAWQSPRLWPHPRRPQQAALCQHRASHQGRGRRLHGTAAATGSVTTDDNSAAARLADLYPGLSRAQAEATTRPPRFYLPAPLPGVGQVVRLGADEARHASRALRLREGDELELCDGEGRLCLARLAAASGSRQDVAVEALELPREVPWAGPRLELAVGCGGLSASRSDWLVEKATELGASALRPLLCERTSSVLGFHKEPRKKGKAAAEPAEDSGREARWARIALAATKQSLRAHSLRLQPTTSVADICAAVSAADVCLVAAAGAPEILAEGSCLERLRGLRAGSCAVLIVGPEGDLTPEELDALIAAGAIPVGLGSTRLRVETAALALLAVSKACCDGLG